MSNKPNAVTELRRIDDAIEESILNASGDELRDELADEGLDPEKVVAEMDAIAREAKLAGAKIRLEEAQSAVESFKSRRTDSRAIDKAKFRAKLQQMRSGTKGDGEGLMMAARKGRNVSQSDEDGLLDDLAQLEALEAQDDEASDE